MIAGPGRVGIVLDCADHASAEIDRARRDLAALLPMSEEELAAIESREKMATPAWSLALHIDEPRAIVSADDMSLSLLALDRDGMAIFDRVEDARFAVEARSDVPRLLSEVRRLRQKVADMEAANREQIRRADEIAWVPS